MLGASGEREILAACQVLFGPEVAVTREFLEILYPSGVKAAFRCRARETHPDVSPAPLPGDHQSSPSFHQVTAAYSQLTSYCQRRARREQHRSRYSAAATHGMTSGFSAGRSSGDSSRSAVYYAGAVPQRQLPFGRYLYVRRIIPYHLLLAALAWQRQQRPSIGQLARNWGWLQTAEVLQVLSTREASGLFGEKAQQLGLLSPRQVTMLLNCQRQKQRRLGEYFVEHGYLTRRQLAQALAEFGTHNAMAPAH